TYDLIIRASKIGMLVVEAAAAVVEHVVVSIVMGVAALSVVMPRRIGCVIVVAAIDGKVIMAIVMGRLQRVGAVGFLPDRQLAADFIYIEVVNSHGDVSFLYCVRSRAFTICDVPYTRTIRDIAYNPDMHRHALHSSRRRYRSVRRHGGRTRHCRYAKASWKCHGGCSQ